jgi:16S rRNA (uracil1498-N3)-methyltransferase
VTAHRFFVEGTREVGGVVEIEGGDAHKIARVLRLREDDRIEIVDSASTAFTAVIAETGRVVRARLLEIVKPSDTSVATRFLEVAQAVPKGNRMDFVVEKGSELGASAFIPFYCERSVRRDVGNERLGRWRRVTRAAAMQCGRRDIPEVRDPLGFEALLASFRDYDAVLFAWELAPAAPLSERLRAAVPTSGRVLLVVGPEGGFTHEEAEAARQNGATLFSLGPRILRTDTAALVLLAVIGALAS